MRRSNSNSLSALAAAAACVAAGCGESPDPRRAAAAGTVTVGGAPLPAGTVVFTPAGGGPRASARIVDGRFALAAAAGPAVGANRATVTPTHPDAPAADDESAPARLAADPPPRGLAPAPPETFDAAVAAEGANEFDFALPAAR